MAMTLVLLKWTDTRRYFVMRNVVSSSALLIMIIVLFCVKTCTANASHEYNSYDDGIRSVL